METLDYEIRIHAPITEVWDMLWNPQTYPQWRQFLRASAPLESDWKVGGRTYFKDAEGKGFASTIVSLDPPFEVVFRHLGTVENGEEDTQSREVKQWSGMEEKYFLRAVNEQTTELHVIVHAYQDHEEKMNDGYGRGLKLLKSIAESDGL